MMETKSIENSRSMAAYFLLQVIMWFREGKWRDGEGDVKSPSATGSEQLALQNHRECYPHTEHQSI